MHRLLVSCLAAAVLLVGCASQKVRVPPRIDLARQGTLGMVGFAANGPDHLAEMATRQFLAVIQGAQPGVPILELGDEASVLAAVDAEEMDMVAAKAIGKKYGVDAVLVGAFHMEKARPTFSMGSLLESMRASADIEAVLSARILQTRSGATIWTNAARGKQSVASVDFAGSGVPTIGATDLEGAEARLVRSLVSTLTGDFRPHWVQQ